MINDWSLMKKLIWLRGSPISGGGAWTTISGAIVEFITQRAHKLKSCVVNLSPKQDLHGYDAPWPAGGGKNKFNKDDASSLLALFINPETGNLNTISDNRSAVISCKANTTYTVSNGIKTTLRVSSFVNAPVSGSIATAHNSPEGQAEAGTGLTITTGANDAYLVVQFIANADISAGVTAEQAIAQLMVEEGSSVSAWTPYENICPIIGWTGCDVFVRGKNLLDPNYRQNLTANVQFYIGTGLLLKANTTYTFSVSAASAQNQVVEIGGSQLAVNYGKTSLTFTPSKDTYVYIDSYYAGGSPPPSGGTSAIDCQLEIGSTATEYEPYNGNSYSVTFEETVYGATPDIVSGEMPVTMRMVDLGSLTWTKTGSGSQIFFYAALSNGSKDDTSLCVCSMYKTAMTALEFQDNDKICRQYGSEYWNFSRIGIKDSAYNDSTATEFKAAMSGVQLVYTLETPTTASITPTPITALKGYNAMWSDGGDIEVTVRGTPVEVSTQQALNMLLGGAYHNNQTVDDVSDEEALDIILGGEQR